MFQQKIPMCQLENIYEAKVKDKSGTVTGTKPVCELKSIEGRWQVDIAQGLEIDKLKENTYGDAVVEMRFRKASYFEYGQERDSVGAFPCKLIGYTMVGLSTPAGASKDVKF